MWRERSRRAAGVPHPCPAVCDRVRILTSEEIHGLPPLAKTRAQEWSNVLPYGSQRIVHIDVDVGSLYLSRDRKFPGARSI